MAKPDTIVNEDSNAQLSSETIDLEELERLTNEVDAEDYDADAATDDDDSNDNSDDSAGADGDADGNSQDGGTDDTGDDDGGEPGDDSNNDQNDDKNKDSDGKLAGIFDSVNDLEKGYKNLLGEFTRVAQILKERANPNDGDQGDSNQDGDDGDGDSGKNDSFDPFNRKQIDEMIERRAAEIVEKRLKERDQSNSTKQKAEQMLDKFRGDYPDADVSKVYQYAVDHSLPDLESAYVMMLKEEGNLSVLLGDSAGKSNDDASGDTSQKPDNKQESKNPVSPSMNRMPGDRDNPSRGDKQPTPWEIAENPRLLDKLSKKDRMEFLRKYS